ncbi:hypothetical protein MCOR04_002726 [Pyricularia oryzae]|nr:hypothetical protein MCOR17_005284 [Pyricularia oryzae]KAI6597807.1 hypothetical protein MCOR04_002726 [Pyricularia oryzae]
MRRSSTTGSRQHQTNAGFRASHPGHPNGSEKSAEPTTGERGRNGVSIPTGPRNPSVPNVYKNMSTTKIQSANVQTGQPVPPTTPHWPGADPEVPEPPEINNYGLAIFALTDEDLTQPMDDRPRDRVERVKRMLDSIDKYQQGVRATTMNIVASERQRIMRHEVNSQTSGRDPGISQDEVDELIEALSAEPEEGTDYNMDTDDITREAMRDLVEGSESCRDREGSLRRLQYLAEQSIYYSDEFDAEIAKVRGKWEAILEKEQKALEEFV